MEEINYTPKKELCAHLTSSSARKTPSLRSSYLLSGTSLAVRHARTPFCLSASELSIETNFACATGDNTKEAKRVFFTSDMSSVKSFDIES